MEINLFTTFFLAAALILSLAVFLLSIFPIRKKTGKIIALDFDGVIHSYPKWKGMGVIEDPPVPGAIDFIRKLEQNGYRVAIYSSRSRSFAGRRAMKKWLRKHIFEYYGEPDTAYNNDAPVTCRPCRLYDHIEWPLFKPMAHLTIDDRGYRFNGKFPAIVEINESLPWNRREKS